MTFLRKLEIVCGLATAMLGVLATAQMFVVELNTSRRLNESFPISRWVFGALGLYTITYKAPSGGQSLKIRLTILTQYFSPNWNVALEAATLQ